MDRPEDVEIPMEAFALRLTDVIGRVDSWGEVAGAFVDDLVVPLLTIHGSKGRALIDLGIGLWLNEPAAKTYAASLRARGKKGGVIACALANRANRIAYALVRDQATYDPTRWIQEV